MPELNWQKSSFSEDQANCLYIAAVPGGTVRFRESDAPDEILTTAHAQLTALLTHLKHQAPRQG
ncbi:DUF397 domain-containing protein [Streptomyces sp. NBC_01381]|uniref:DUF397 domain-containing protein n=1 Tax=Streptomyces sp. NBC_01381 TaxID=2903845 RepID=UPI00225B98EA|nr:DUF397 domain-containing protein [Streptomyces sp. NBC_01381]MCX4665603.1 DUF397 domain-containing protein [Streptomyces sp. NBC_01381]